MVVLVGSKHLARLHIDDTRGCVTAVLVSLLNGHDNASANACHTLDTLRPRAGGRGQVWRAASGDRIGSKPLSSRSGRHRGDTARLWMEAPSGGQTAPLGSAMAPATRIPLGRVGRAAGSLLTSTWDQAKRSLLNSATARALASTLLRCPEACNDV